MEKIIHKTTMVTTASHDFYCDGCGKYLGTSEELPDGYCEQLGEFQLTYYTPRGWYGLDKHLCDTCKEQFLLRFYNTLEGMGFKPN